ncbi:MAG: hypothetical protein U0Q55_10270 [Vicinamibacterales bacterium]
MDLVQPPLWMMLLTPAILVLQIAWSVGVTILLVRIWRKVKQLPG